MSDFLDAREVYPLNEYAAVSESRIRRIETEAEEIKEKFKIQQGVSQMKAFISTFASP